MASSWKQKFCVLAVTCGLLAGLHAENYQKIYPITSNVYHVVTRLYVLQGLALPSSSGPWSGSELSLMLDRLDYDALSPVEKQWYDSARYTLDADAGKRNLHAGVDATLETYIHPNPGSKYFRGSDNWFRGWPEQHPLVVIPVEGTISSLFYGYIEADIAQAQKWNDGENQPAETMGEEWFTTNLPIHGVDLFVPYRALLATGGKNWSFEIGRDRLSWGSGTTGNLLVGDQVQYHNMARIAAYNDALKYTFLISAFPHPKNYYFYDSADPSQSGYKAEGVKEHDDYENGVKAYIAHRLEARFWKNRIGVAVTDSVMYMSDTNKIDLIDFNPAMFYHNNFKRGLTNTIFGLEFDMTVMRGWNIYSQVVIDDWASSGETKPSEATGDDKAEPNAVGVIAGSTYVRRMGDGVLSINLEGAYTSPYLYLRDSDVQGKSPADITAQGIRSQKLGQYGINFVVGTHSSYYREQFLGYKYGCDAMVANLRVAYEKLNAWSLTGNLFYMAHGTHDQFTVWSQIDNVNVNDGWLPSSSPETDNQYDPNASDRDAVAHTFVIGLNGACQFKHGCSVFGQMDYVVIRNPGNISDNGTIQDLQLTIGLEWKVDDVGTLIWKRKKD